MEGYRLVAITVGAPMIPIELKGSKFVLAITGVSGQRIHKGEFPEYAPDAISMPVGTIFLNYVPERERSSNYTGTLYCLVPEWQIEGV